MADTADHLSPEPVLTDTIATPLEGDDLQAVQATMSMVTGEVSDGSTDTESSLQASAPATSLPAIPENPDDPLSTPQATAQLLNIVTFNNQPSSPVQDDQNFDTPRPSAPEAALEAAEDQLRETSRQKLFQHLQRMKNLEGVLHFFPNFHWGRGHDIDFRSERDDRPVSFQALW